MLCFESECESDRFAHINHLWIYVGIIKPIALAGSIQIYGEWVCGDVCDLK
jgi:hypothetical protein